MYNVDQKKWNQFSRDTQLKNIASELVRVKSAGLYNDEEKRRGACLRAISLIDASIVDKKWEDKKYLYELRNVVSSIFVEKSNPAISNFIYNQILAKNVSQF